MRTENILTSLESDVKGLTDVVISKLRNGLSWSSNNMKGSSNVTPLVYDDAFHVGQNGLSNFTKSV